MRLVSLPRPLLPRPLQPPLHHQSRAVYVASGRSRKGRPWWCVEAGSWRTRAAAHTMSGGGRRRKGEAVMQGYRRRGVVAVCSPERQRMLLPTTDARRWWLPTSIFVHALLAIASPPSADATGPSLRDERQQSREHLVPPLPSPGVLLPGALMIYMSFVQIHCPLLGLGTTVVAGSWIRSLQAVVGASHICFTNHLGSSFLGGPEKIS